METDLFTGPRLKIERAKRHINELESSLTIFLRTNPYNMRVEVDPKTGQNFLRFHTTKPAPEELPLIIGDAVHNMRGALDLLFSAMLRNVGESDSAAYFPFHETRENLVDSLSKGKIQGIKPGITDLILDSIQPYKTGNNTLWALNKLDVLDKHRLLIPVVHAFALTGVHLEDENHNVFTDLTLQVAIDGQLMTPISTSAKLHIKDYGKPAIGISFGKGQPLEGEAIVPTLHKLAQMTSGIVETFATFLSE